MCMRSIYGLIIGGLLWGLAGFGQSFHVITDNDDLAIIQLPQCVTTVIAPLPNNIGTITDIAFTPDGKLYGVNSIGALYELDPLTAAATWVHTFPNGPAAFYTSATADENGIIYVAGRNGVVRTFDPATGVEGLIGWVNFDGAAGDLTFVNTQLVMAANTNQMVAINFEDASASEAILDFIIGGKIFGIVTFAEDCENQVTFATDNSNNSRIYRVNFETGQLEFICAASHGIYGAATPKEFQAATTVCITDIQTTTSSCLTPNGSVTITASGGTGDLSYSLDGMNFQNSNLFENLAPGEYTIYVQDENGVTYSTPFIIPSTADEIEILGISRQDDFCSQQIGSLAIIADSPYPPVMYSINGVDFQPGGDFLNLAAGGYPIYVADGQGCVFESFASINNVAGPQIQNVAVMACGFPDNQIEVTAVGNGPFSYSIDGEDFQASSTFEGFPAGDYSIVVEDINGCRTSQNVTVINYPSLSFTALTVQNCGPGSSSIESTATGGQGNLNFALNNGEPQASGQFQALSPGTHHLVVTDESGCLLDTSIIIIPYDAPDIASVSIQPSLCNEANGGITLEIRGEAPPFQLSLNGREMGAVNRIDELSPGIHALIIEDQNGCILADSLLVHSECPVFIPNVFSPNDDGFNDFFQLYSGLPFQVLTYQVFDRWGSLVYESERFGSVNTEQFWDGKIGGKAAPVGIYTYRIEWENLFGELEQESGDVLLLR